MYQTPVEQPPNKRQRVGKPPKKASSKSGRREKIYSDFVGVTYNNKHAKNQAFITHYL
jgi:hypothetical protein